MNPDVVLRIAKETIEITLLVSLPILAWSFRRTDHQPLSGAHADA